MPLYKVLTDINCGKYKPGDVVEFSETEAAQMPHAVERIEDTQREEQASSEPKKKRGKK